MHQKDSTHPLKNELFSQAMSRRSALGAVAMAAATLLPTGAHAQAVWPSRPVKIIDVYAPGGSGDLLARAIANKLAPRIGQPVLVENRPGAGGAIGTDFVAKSPADGYTLMLSATGNAVAEASLVAGRKLPFDWLKDFTPVGQIGSTPLVIVVAHDSPIKTLRDLVELARAKPNDGVRYGTSGVGSMSHIGTEMLASVANVQLMHVPYKGNSLAFTDLLGGQLQAMLGSVATFSSMLESGKMRAIVVTSPKRSPFLPNVPTSTEAGFPEFQIEYWWGLMAPANTPRDVVKRLNTELNLILALPDIRELLSRVAATPTTVTPEEFGRLNAFEVTRWSKLIKDKNIKME